MDEPQAPVDVWEEFKSWHRGSALYRDVYTRALGTVVAALVLYMVAAVAGLVDRGPATVLAATCVIPCALLLLFSLPGMISNWSQVRPLFIVWNDEPTAVMRHARRHYNRFIWGFMLTAFSSAIFVALLVSG